MSKRMALSPTAVMGSMPHPQYVKDLLAARRERDGPPNSEIERRTDDAMRFVMGLQEQEGTDVVSDGG